MEELQRRFLSCLSAGYTSLLMSFMTSPCFETLCRFIVRHGVSDWASYILPRLQYWLYGSLSFLSSSPFASFHPGIFHDSMGGIAARHYDPSPLGCLEGLKSGVSLQSLHSVHPRCSLCSRTRQLTRPAPDKRLFRPLKKLDR